MALEPNPLPNIRETPATFTNHVWDDGDSEAFEITVHIDCAIYISVDVEILKGRGLSLRIIKIQVLFAPS
jgi:hypothetical protein